MNIYETYGKSENFDVIPLNYFRSLFFRKNYKKILEGLHSNSKILEIGPGGGTFTEYLLHCGFVDVTICEYSTVIASKLKKYFLDRPEVKIIQGNVLNYLSKKGPSYDVIIAMEVIEHFEFTDFLRLLSGLYECTSKNGVIVLETNNCANVIYGLYLRYCDHTHRAGFTPRSLASFLKTGGFRVERFFPIFMTNIIDVALCFFHGMRGSTSQRVQTFNRTITQTPLWRKIKFGLLFLMRGIGVLISKWISYLLIYPYDISLGTEKTVFTPTFGIIARKIELEDGIEE